MIQIHQTIPNNRNAKTSTNAMDNKMKSGFIYFRSLCAAFLLVVLFNAEFAIAQSTNAGTAGAQFLKINAGARAEAMGGAYVGLADDAGALFWNPAGIGWISGSSVTFTNIRWWTGIDINQVAGAISAGNYGTIGLSVINLSVPQQEITTVDNPDGTGRFFDAADLMIGVSYAKKLLPEFSVGVTAKYVHQRIWNQSAQTLAFDIGTQYRFGFRNLTLGMTVQNFGLDMKYGGRDLTRFAQEDPNNPGSRRPLVSLNTLDFPLPLSFQVGAAIDAVHLSNFRWIITTDLKNPSDNYEQLSFGNELQLLTETAGVALRGGYTVNNPDQKWAVGAGVHAKVSGTTLKVDYSYSEHEYLSGIQRLTFSVNF
jgi:hypothetical protein